MAVQFADKALDEWLTAEIAVYQRLFELNPTNMYARGYLDALYVTQKQLRAFWGSALESSEQN